MLGSILKQLVESCSYVPDDVLSMFEDLKSKSKQPDEEQAERAIGILVQTFTRVFVIIDAFHECQQNTSSNLLKALSCLRNQPRLSLLVTSRISDEILCEFSQALSCHISVLKQMLHSSSLVRWNRCRPSSVFEHLRRSNKK